MAELSVAFLRGINVGGHRVKMDRLRELFAEMGFEDARTFIASGNVVFATRAGAPEAVEMRIEEALADALGYDVPTFVRSLDQVVRAYDRTWPDAGVPFESGAHYVAFLKDSPATSAQVAFSELTSDDDVFRFDDRELHWFTRGRISESPLFGGPFERASRDLAHTMRNVTTLRRLVSRFGDAPRARRT